MPRSRIYSLLIALVAAPFLFGQPASGTDEGARARWDAAWNAALSSAPFAPSVLAREIVRAELGAQTGESEEVHARRAFETALRVERALRLGTNSQEARAQLRQILRLQASAGTENAKKMAGRLAKAERKNLKSGNAVVGTNAGLGTGIGSGSGSQSGSGKGQSGQ